MINLDLIVGARPNFMKIAPIIKAIEKHNLELGTRNENRGKAELAGGKQKTRNPEPYY